MRASFWQESSPYTRDLDGLATERNTSFAVANAGYRFREFPVRQSHRDDKRSPI
ncbi:hypothetical protein [Novipirellula galeiformis]|uniref:hypothetical protein n=1 Tax=Novipirellula galeiformis TaxID=2528004 RepID=UPI0018CD09CD|nr:hypothetical protein [Novipirellula galeiformis]